MKTYDLYFVRGVNMYVFNTREDALARTIIAELKDGAILTALKRLTKMNNKDLPTMQSITALAKGLPL